MTGQISAKVSGLWRLLLRRDNGDVRVINSGEEYVLTLNNGSESGIIQFTMMSTEMTGAPIYTADETKAFAPDPHEPDKTEEDRNIPHDPELASTKTKPEVSTDRLRDETKSGMQGWLDDEPRPGETVEEFEARRAANITERDEASRLAGEEQARKEEEERAAKQKILDEAEEKKSKSKK